VPPAPVVPVVTVAVTTFRTVTVTTSSEGLYLGLYGWASDGRPMFRLNETAATPTLGATFGPRLVYKGAYTGKSVTCANVTYGGQAKSLCEGDVLELG
jgi:hypothetical protein